MYSHYKNVNYSLIITEPSMRIGEEFQASIPELASPSGKEGLITGLRVITMCADGRGKGVGSILVWAPTDKLMEDDSEYMSCDVVSMSCDVVSRSCDP